MALCLGLKRPPPLKKYFLMVDGPHLDKFNATLVAFQGPPPSPLTCYSNKGAHSIGPLVPNATPPIGKIHPFNNIGVTFEPVMQFRCP